MRTLCGRIAGTFILAIGGLILGQGGAVSGAELALGTPQIATNWVHRTNQPLYLSSSVAKFLSGGVELSVSIEMPQDQHADLGEAAVFKVSSNFEDALYQWVFQCSRIEGATNDTLLLSQITEENAGYYSCVVYRGLGFVVSQPMQLIVVMERGPTNIILAAKAPPGLGGMAAEPIPMMQLLQKPPTKKTSSITPDAWRDENSRNVASGVGAPAPFAASLAAVPLSLMTYFMQVPTSTNVVQNYMYTVSATGTGCPKPYSGYLRFTTGWYPKPGATVIQVYGPGGLSNYSAISFDDTTRQGCAMGNSFDLKPFSPSTTRPHRFVAFLQTPPSATTTYYLHLTGFQ